MLLCSLLSHRRPLHPTLLKLETILFLNPIDYISAAREASAVCLELEDAPFGFDSVREAATMPNVPEPTSLLAHLERALQSLSLFSPDHPS